MMKLYFIGSSSLLRRCIQQALIQGFIVNGVVPTDDETRQWAIKHDISVLSLSELTHRPKHSFDYLFSIVNPTILDESILALPQLGVINFHDGPLPRYAGVHATSWAILNGETTHAITWHFVDKDIDTGDILFQPSVAILPDDTAYTFNLRCFNIALTSFNILLQKIKQGITPTPQGLSMRMYFSYAKKPTGNGIIHWRSSVNTIDRLVRATYYGHHANDFSCAKCLLHGQWLITPTLCIRNEQSNVQPGHFIEMDDHHLCVSTGSNGGVCIHELFTLTGKKIDLAELVRTLKHDEVTQLSLISDAERENFQAFSERVFKYESYWVNELKKVEPSTFPFHNFTLERKKTYNKAKPIQWQISSKKLTALKQKFPKIPIPSILLAGLLLYMYRINQNDRISIGINQPVQNALLTAVTQQLIHLIRPFNVCSNKNISIIEWIIIIHEHYNTIAQREPFLMDVFYRYILDDVLSNVIVVHYTDNLKKIPVESIKQIHIQILTDGSLRWFIPSNDPLWLHVDRLYRHLDHLFEQFLLDSNATIHHLSIVPITEYTLIKKINQTAVDFPSKKTLYELFLEQATRYPDKTAIIDGQRSITYRTLLRDLQQVALTLAGCNVRKGSFVGLWMNRSIEALISMLAITALGAAYVPLRVKDPLNRVMKAITNAAIHHILIRGSELEKNTFDLLPSEIQLIDVLSLFGVPHRSLFQYIPFPSSYAAYVNYTSGTTGEPKGTIISHRNIIRLVKNQSYFDLSPKNIFAHISDLAFDATTLIVWGALLNGATICVISSQSIIKIPVFKKRFSVCTGSFITPTLLKQILSEDVGFFDHLHQLIVGGEVFDAHIARLLLHRKKTKNLSLQLVNGYGPTECTAAAICHPLNSLPIDASAVPIGKPIYNTTAYVLDNHQKLLPLGIKGELYLGGEGVAKGYLNNEEETKRCFIQTTLGRLYKTGDLAVINPQSLNFLFQGRSDFQIKLRGFRIELADIKSHLLQQSNVKDAVVQLVDDKKQKKLIAFIVLKTYKKSFDIHTIRNRLAQVLPDYMVPNRLIVVKNFPLQKSGKVDYQILQKIAMQHLKTIPLKTKQTNILLRLVEEYLQVNGITGDESYQSLGGDSITTMQIVSKAREQGLTIDPIRLFESERLNQVLPQAVDQRAHTHTTYLTTIDTLSPIQYWYFNQKLRQPSRFTQVIQLRLGKQWSSTLLKIFLKKLIEAHPILATRFEKQAMTLVSDPSIHLYTIQLKSKTNKSTRARLLHKLESQITVTQGTLLQAGLLCTHTQQTLILMVHHLVIDGVSWRILLNDLAQLMRQHINGETLTLLPEQTSFLTWVDHLQKQTKRFYTTTEVNYWVDQCTSIEHERSTVENLQKNARTITRVFSTVDPWYQNGLSINEKYFSPFIVLLTHTIHALSLWQQQSDVFIMLESHGRYPFKTGIDLSRTVGWFTSIYPFYFNVKKNIIDIALLEMVKSRLSDIPQHGMGYSILKELQSCESIKKLPTPDISFNYFGNFDHSMTPTMRQFFEFSDEGIQLYNGPLNTRQHQIDITCYVYQGKIYFHIGYNHFLFSRKKMDEFFKFLKGSFKKFDKFSIVHQSYLPLSAMQQGLLFHSIQHSRSPIYWVRVKWDIIEALDVSCYKQAFGMLLSQYPQLNISIGWDTKGGMRQLLSKKITLPFRYIDKARHQSTKNKSTWEKETPMIRPLNKSPLFTITVVKLDINHYITLFDHHHVLLDGWSVGLLLNTLVRNYKHLKDKKAAIVVPLQDNRAYIKYLSTMNKQSAKKFWQHYLQDVNPLLSLGIEKKNAITKKKQNIHVRREIYSFSVKEVKKIDQVAKKYGVTQNVIFQTAWAMVLSCYTNQREVTFGFTISLRNLEGFNLSEQVGLYINTLPFRIILNSNSHIKTVWQTINQSVQKILCYGYVSLVELKQWVQSSVSNGDFFNSLYVFENFPFQLDSFFKELSIYDPTHYPLVLGIEAREKYKIILTYDEMVYEIKTSKTLLHHYLTVLNKLVTHPCAVLKDIDIFTQKEKNNILNQLQLKKSSADKNIISAFEAQVANNPQKIAVTHQSIHLTYAELNHKSNQLAHYLLSQSALKKNTKVALLLPKSIELVITILAVFKVGGCYIPMDQHLPTNRVNFILTDSKPSILLSLRKLISKNIDQSFGSVILLDEIQHQLLSMPTKNVSGNTIESDTLAYMIYTSGTTGYPKGTLIPHKNLPRLFKQVKKWFDFSSNDSWTLFHSPAFDFSVWEMWGALMHGGRLVIVPYETARSPGKFYHLIQSEKITVLNLTPTAFNILSNYESSIKATKKFSLRYIIFGGEMLTFSTLKYWSNKHGVSHPKLINMYGITETTIHTTFYRIKKKDIENSTQRSIIGHPIPDMRILLLDKHLNFVPKGAMGMIYVGGYGLAQGYLNQPALTKHHFIQNPYPINNASILYKSGDLGRLLPNGCIEYCGRCDNQIKVRGFRVELDEIRTNILQIKGILNALIYMIDHQSEKKIVAFLFVKDINRVNKKYIRSQLSKQLPQYMIPSSFLILKEIPTTTTGKIDQKALIAIYRNKTSQATITSNKNQVIDSPELHALKSIWIEILGKKDFTVNESFFVVGGHSLLALQLIRRIFSTFTVELNISDIYLSPTLRKLIHVILEKKKKSPSPKHVQKKSPAILLRKSTTNKNVFFIHPVGGTIFWFVSLAPTIATPINVYGIQDPGIETGTLLLSSIEELASFYVKAVQAIQTRGPYILGGSSFGANVSVEMARQLAKSGHKIEKLLLLDGWAKFPKTLSQREFLQKNMWRQYREITQILSDSKDVLKLKPIIDLSWYRARQLDAYKLQPFPFETVLFKAQETVNILKTVESKTNHWGEYASRLKIVQVPGDHETMFYPPHVKWLGQLISRELFNC